MTKITYDYAKLDDIDAIMSIEEKDFSENEALSRASMLERIHRIPDTFIVARNDEGRVVGYIAGPVTASRYLSDACFEHSDANPKSGGFQKVVSLAVDPDFQGLGVAKQLLERLKEVAHLAGRTGISLTCHDYLIPYYEKHCFTNEGLSESKLGGETWYNMVLVF